MKRYFKNSSEMMLKIRASANMSQKELANIICLTSQAISNIERGLCKIPARHIHIMSVISKIPHQEILDAVNADNKEILFQESIKPAIEFKKPAKIENRSHEYFYPTHKELLLP
jgi:transcriptional regulator with XRE-family HTH domain